MGETKEERDAESGASSGSAPIAKKPLAWREIATFWMLYTVVVGFFGLVIFLVVNKAISESNLMLLLGNISGGFVVAYSFYGGSSQGSTVKGEAQSRVVEKLADKAEKAP